MYLPISLKVEMKQILELYQLLETFIYIIYIHTSFFSVLCPIIVGLMMVLKYLKDQFLVMSEYPLCPNAKLYTIQETRFPIGTSNYML